jgi:hypothetical protein
LAIRGRPTPPLSQHRGPPELEEIRTATRNLGGGHTVSVVASRQGRVVGYCSDPCLLLANFLDDVLRRGDLDDLYPGLREKLEVIAAEARGYSQGAKSATRDVERVADSLEEQLVAIRRQYIAPKNVANIIQDHHTIPWDNKSFNHRSHPLVKQAGTNLRKHPTNLKPLKGHIRRHRTSYHRRRAPQDWHSTLGTSISSQTGVAPTGTVRQRRGQWSTTCRCRPPQPAQCSDSRGGSIRTTTSPRS